MTPMLGGLITQMCHDLKCTEVDSINMLKKCKRYANPSAHLRGKRFMCPSQPIVTKVEEVRVRVGQQKSKRKIYIKLRG